ncbi:MAG: HIT family protein [Gemmatimonadales bacterium]
MPVPCVFCQILSGELPGTFIYRDQECAAFMDAKPINPGHILIVPVQHAAYLSVLERQTAGRLMELAHRLVAALRASSLRCAGVNLFLADGEAAMQEIFHVHLHVFPRYNGDGFGLRFGPHYKKQPRAELEIAAASIAKALITIPPPVE